MNKLLKIKIMALALGVVSIISIWGITSAQEESVILTWQADSFYPADYKGKVPATPGSTVYVSASLVINNRIKNLPSGEFVWRVNGHFFNKGIGMDKISFKISEIEGPTYSISVLIRAEGGEYSNSIKIPVGEPELVIENPRPSKFVNLGEKVILEAVPYFFNVNSLSELSFSWWVNNIMEKGERTNSLVLNIGDADTLRGTIVPVMGAVMNKNNPIESAKSNLELRVR